MLKELLRYLDNDRLWGVNNLEVFLDLGHSLAVLELDVCALNRSCLFLESRIGILEMILIKNRFFSSTVLGFLTEMVVLPNKEVFIQVT